MSGKNFPEQHHRAAVGDRHVGGGERAPIIRIVANFHKRRRGRHHQQATVRRHRVDCLIDAAVEEAHAENLF